MRVASSIIWRSKRSRGSPAIGDLPQISTDELRARLQGDQHLIWLRPNSARFPPSSQTPRVWFRLDARTCPPTRDDPIDVGAPIRFARCVEPSNSRWSYLRFSVDSIHRPRICRHRTVVRGLRPSADRHRRDIPGGRRSHLLWIPPEVGGAAPDSFPSDWIGCQGGIFGATGVDGDAEGARGVGHRAVDSDAELRVPEIGPGGIEDGEGDIPVEAELVDCGGNGALQGGAWRVINSLPVERSR
jgi:hypothetical protein